MTTITIPLEHQTVHHLFESLGGLEDGDSIRLDNPVIKAVGLEVKTYFFAMAQLVQFLQERGWVICLTPTALTCTPSADDHVVRKEWDEALHDLSEEDRKFFENIKV